MLKKCGRFFGMVRIKRSHFSLEGHKVFAASYYEDTSQHVREKKGGRCCFTAAVSEDGFLLSSKDNSGSVQARL